MGTMMRRGPNREFAEAIEALRLICQNNRGRGQASAHALGLRTLEIPRIDAYERRFLDWEFEVDALLKKHGFALVAYNASTHILDVRLDQPK